MTVMKLPAILAFEIAKELELDIYPASIMDYVLPDVIAQEEKLGASDREALITAAFSQNIITQERKLDEGLADIFALLLKPYSFIKLEYQKENTENLKIFFLAEDKVYYRIVVRGTVFEIDKPVAGGTPKLEGMVYAGTLVENRDAILTVEYKTPYDNVIYSMAAGDNEIVAAKSGKKELIAEAESYEISEEGIKKLMDFVFPSEIEKKLLSGKAFDLKKTFRGVLIALAVYVCVAIFTFILRSILM